MKTLSHTIIASLLLSATACSSDNSVSSEPSAPEETAFKVSTRALEGDPTGFETLDNELLQSWWVAVVDPATRRVEAVKNRPSNNTAFTEEAFEMTVRQGVYDVYAFGNYTALPQALQNELAAVTAGSTLDKTTFEGNVSFEATYPAGTLIPMSGVLRNVRIAGRVETPVTIEVVRMLAKLEFEFINSSTTSLSIGNLTLGLLRQGPVLRFPTFAAGSTDIAAPTILPGSEEQTPTLTFNPAIAPTAGNPVKHHFYVRETTAAPHLTGQFHISVPLSRDGKPASESLSALIPGKDATSGIDAIRRNDYIQVPLRFTDWILRLEVNFYPPIGGLPAVVKEERNDEYYIKFGSSGAFEFIPYLRKFNETEYVALKTLATNVTITKVSDPNNIIKTDLTYNTASGEFLGEISDQVASGTAQFKITIAVTDNSVTHTFSRNFYISKE